MLSIPLTFEEEAIKRRLTNKYFLLEAAVGEEVNHAVDRFTLLAQYSRDNRVISPGKELVELLRIHFPVRIVHFVGLERMSNRYWFATLEMGHTAIKKPVFVVVGGWTTSSESHATILHCDGSPFHAKNKVSDQIEHFENNGYEEVFDLEDIELRSKTSSLPSLPGLPAKAVPVEWRTEPSQSPAIVEPKEKKPRDEKKENKERRKAIAEKLKSSNMSGLDRVNIAVNVGENNGDSPERIGSLLMYLKRRGLITQEDINNADLDGAVTFPANSADVVDKVVIESSSVPATNSGPGPIDHLDVYVPRGAESITQEERDLLNADGRMNDEELIGVINSATSYVKKKSEKDVQDSSKPKKKRKTREEREAKKRKQFEMMFGDMESDW